MTPARGLPGAECAKAWPDSRPTRRQASPMPATRRAAAQFNCLRNNLKSGFLPGAVRNKIDNQSRLVGIILAVLSIFLVACGNRGHAVSGTIEVDEAHVGPRAGGRVEKILAWEGDHLHEGQLIAQLDASELRARRDLAAAQIDTAVHDADAQQAQLVFLQDEARRQQDLLQRRVVSSSDAERAGSSAKTQEKNLASAKMRVAQARAQLADIDSQLAEMQVVASADSVLEVLSVKVGDVLPANREAATLLLTGH